MECAVCNFKNSYSMLNCMGGKCKSCNIEIQYPLCNECSIKNNKCYSCDIDLINYNIGDNIEKLIIIRDSLISRFNDTIALCTKFHVEVSEDDLNKINLITDKYNGYLISLKSGKTNFK